MVIRGAPFAATGRSYGDHRSQVGAVIGRESDDAVYQVIRGVPFAANGRSYGGSLLPRWGGGPIGCLRVNIAALFILYVGCP